MGQVMKTGLNVNVELSKLPMWCNSHCARCGRKPSEAVLNIEAVIHHNAKELLCIDYKKCARYAKRKKH